MKATYHRTGEAAKRQGGSAGSLGWLRAASGVSSAQDAPGQDGRRHQQ
jgi:hypothetical protein